MPHPIAGARLRHLAGLAVMAALWLSNLGASRRQDAWAATTRAMCAGLPAYAELAVALDPRGERVLYTTDRAEPEASESFFCAQYALAPSLLERRDPTASLGRRWIEETGPRSGPPSRGALLLDLADAEARRAILGAAPAKDARVVARSGDTEIVRLGCD